MAEAVRLAITDGRAVSIAEYKNLAATVPLEKIGFSFVWILVHAHEIKKFFPDAVADALSARLKNFEFDSFALKFLEDHKHFTASEIGKLFFVDGHTIAQKSRGLKIKLKAGRRLFSQEEKETIREYASTDIGIAAKKIGITRREATYQAKFLGLKVKRQRFIEWSAQEDQVVRQAMLDKKTDEETSNMLPGRSKNAVMKRRWKLQKQKSPTKAP